MQKAVDDDFKRTFERTAGERIFSFMKKALIKLTLIQARTRFVEDCGRQRRQRMDICILLINGFLCNQTVFKLCLQTFDRMEKTLLVGKNFGWKN